jgi:hypothetical protein
LILAILDRRGFLVHWPAEPVGHNSADEVLAMVEFREVSEREREREKERGEEKEEEHTN